ncbi:MAG: hypothetical protein U0X92_13175 [Anaerolineales bacterium]
MMTNCGVTPSVLTRPEPARAASSDSTTSAVCTPAVQISVLVSISVPSVSEILCPLKSVNLALNITSTCFFCKRFNVALRNSSG